MRKCGAEHSRGEQPTDAAVVLASAGRPELLASAMWQVDRQRDVRLHRVLSVPDTESLPPGVEESGWHVVSGVRGLAAQRNAALDALQGTPVVFFFDDDALLRPDYIATALRYLEQRPGVVGVTGRVLLDGASTVEVPVDVAERALAESAEEPFTGRAHPSRELYGCNFAVRTEAAPGLRFDDRLPLYSWLEDHDFARRLMRVGQLAKVDDCVAVHRAAASGGRQAHERLGYSQVMNPFYLWKKGSFPTWLMANEALRRVAKNVFLACGGEERAWRRRRLKGNLLAFSDIIRGRITPERILQL